VAVDPNDAMFTVDEVAEILRVSRMTVYRLVHNDEITNIRIGRSFRIPGVALDEYLAANIHKAAIR
jgi:excisionase family DNA binding protein